MNGHTNGTNGAEERTPLPSAKAIVVSPDIVIQPPLTRRGHGPGLVLLVPSGLDLRGHEKTLDPPPLQKWAEEGYAVAQITLTEGGGEKFQGHLKEVIGALEKLKDCDSVEKIGVICELYTGEYVEIC